MSKLKLTLPVKGQISQNFGDNGNSSYSGAGLKGHSGLDCVSRYNDTIESAVFSANKQYVYSILHKDDVNLMNYRSVYQIVEADDGVFEVSYGHCNEINVVPILSTAYGTPLATEGNTGAVYTGGVLVTLAQKQAGSTAGFHVHFQVRRLRKSKLPTDKCLVVANGNPFRDSDGFFFDIPTYSNGYNGCIDPIQFIKTQNNFKFSRDLDVYSFGIDVYQLQKRLVNLGFATFMPTGFFGSLTKQAVILYQEANGIDQVGRVGPLTRNSLNGV